MIAWPFAFSLVALAFVAQRPHTVYGGWFELAVAAAWLSALLYYLVRDRRATAYEHRRDQP